MLAMPSRKPAVGRVRQVNFRLQQDAWEWLAAAAGAWGRSQAEIVAEALQRYRTSLSAADQKLIEQNMLARRRTR
jgi:predicted transcriptional regulator